MSISEAFIATLDISRLLGLEGAKVSKSDISKALNLEVQIVKGAEAFAHQKPAPAFTGTKITQKDAFTYVKVFDYFDSGTLAGAWAPVLESQGIGFEISSDIITAAQTLKSYLPPANESKVPTSGDVRFLWACRLLDNPLYIFDLLCKQQLTDFDVTYIKIAYPETYRSIVDATIDACLSRTDKHRAIPRPVKFGLAILLQTSVISPETMKAYQNSVDTSSKPANINITQTQTKAEVIK